MTTSRHQKQPLGTRLCKTCEETPFEELFEQRGPSTAIELKLCAIAVAQSSGKRCAFCWFLWRCCEIFQPRVSKTSNLYLQVDGAPWYETAGIKTVLESSAVTAWLKFGRPAGLDTKGPYVCISRIDEPFLSQDHIRLSLPRVRANSLERNGYLDHRLVLDWIDLCQTHHGESCNLSLDFKRSFIDIKLIDVRNRKVVPDPGRESYAALSYVWGGEKSSLQSPTGMIGDLLPAHLPQTVTDAISLAGKLQIRYIWVDRYCINQDDEAEKQRQIGNMDLIFECAFLSLIALDGEGVTAGLAGISRPLAFTAQPTIATDKGKYMATYVHHVWHDEGQKTYDSRAWTFQEQVLCRRGLYFDRHHIYLRCEEELFHDCLTVDTTQVRQTQEQHSAWFWQNGWSFFPKSPQFTFNQYATFVANYTQRELSFQEDAMNACQGLLNTFTRSCGVSFIWGLPRKDFLRALLWEKSEEHKVRRRASFPSWSWAGWQGKTSYAYWLHNYEQYEEDANSSMVNNQPFIVSGDGEASSRRRQLPTSHGMAEDHEAFVQLKGMRDDRINEPSDYNLIIFTTVARFDIQRVSRAGDISRYKLNDFGVDLKTIADRWTLIHRTGKPLSNEAFEWEADSEVDFAERDYMFTLQPEDSEALISACGGFTADGSIEVGVVFMCDWPAIKTVKSSDNWLRDMVSALVICPLTTAVGKYWRVACITMRRTDWLAAHPQPQLVEIV